MNNLLNKIHQQNATAFTHSGKFHADDVFSAALLLYLIRRSRSHAAIACLKILTVSYLISVEADTIITRRTAEFVRTALPMPHLGFSGRSLDQRSLAKNWHRNLMKLSCSHWIINDNTGEKNELASLIGNFNPTWDAEGSNDEAFFQAVSVAGMILENKFDRYRGNERADKRVEEIYERHMQAFHDREKHSEDAKILILPEFVPCQKFLSETPVAFVIFPSNRGGYCIQPQKKNTP